jgi:hypothetical protein
MWRALESEQEGNYVLATDGKTKNVVYEAALR